MVLRELSRLGHSNRPHDEHVFLSMQKKPIFVPDSEAFNSYIGIGFLVPELKGESEASKHAQAGREMLNDDEEIRSPKRKIIRVESEETQDCVREEKSTEQEEEQKRTFVPSAVSVPPKLLFRCDKQCSEKTLSCWQLASVVVNEGDEAYTTNLCQKCFNKHLQATGEEPLTNVQRRQAVEKKAYR